MRIQCRAALLASLVVASSSAAAQTYPGFPGTHLTVDVDVRNLAHGGDSVRITYVVRNRPTSEERFLALTVEAPVPASHLAIPQPRQGWHVSTRYAGRSTASWTALDDTMVTPGHSSQPLAFTAYGLPGIVDAHVEGYADPPNIEEMAEDDPRLTKDALEVTSVPIKVVGVVAPIDNPTRAALIGRLIGLAGQTCTIGWLTDAQVCASLDAYLRAPSPRLLAVLATVAAARLRPGAMNDNAYWLLRSNAEIVRDFVDVSDVRLTYVCANTFRLRNLNYVPVVVRYEVDGTTEAATLTLPGLSSDDEPIAGTTITTTASGTVRLVYGGRTVQTATNGGAACQP
jgi:hypothetical protein